MGSGLTTQSQAMASKVDSSHNIRTGLEAAAIATALIDNLHCLQAKPPQYATRNDWYTALAYTVRDRMMHRYIATVESIEVWRPTRRDDQRSPRRQQSARRRRTHGSPAAPSLAADLE